MKDRRGVTLVALVITIIVLLILAGITINLIIGEDGIITKAKESKKTQEIGEIQEELELKKAELAIEKKGKLILTDYIEKIQREEMKNKVTRNK